MPGHEARYSVSNLGRIQSHIKGTRILRDRASSRYGHRKVTLSPGHEGHWVHRLVLRAFVGEPDSGWVARHLDANPENNRLSNLAWGTPQENFRDTARHGSLKGAKNPNAILTEQQARSIKRMTGESVHELTRRFNCTPAIVHSIRQGKSWGWVDA